MTANNDVHIVTGGSDPAAVWAAYSREQARRLIDQQLRHLRDLEAQQSADEKRELVRDEVGKKLVQALEWLEPYVDGTMGEVTVGLAAVYFRGLQQLASVYGVGNRPRKPEAAPVLPVPEAVLSADAENEQRAVATAAAREAVSQQLAVVRLKLGRNPGQG